MHREGLYEIDPVEEDNGVASKQESSVKESQIEEDKTGPLNPLAPSAVVPTVPV
jgi:hypothetical protein